MKKNKTFKVITIIVLVVALISLVAGGFLALLG